MLQYKEYLCGEIVPVAGTGEPGYGEDGTLACRAALNGPAGVALARDGSVYVAERDNNVIRKIDVHTNTIKTVAGCGRCGAFGDGGPALLAALNKPEGVYVDAAENLYIADTYNQRIRKVDASTGIIETIAGCGEIGYNGDALPARDAMLHEPAGVVADAFGNVYFNDYRNDRVRRIGTDGGITVYAGTGRKGYSGDNGPANQAEINEVYGLAIDRRNTLYLMDSANGAIRAIDAETQHIRTVFVGELSNPHAVEVAEDGRVFIADTGNSRILMVDGRTNEVYVLAGTIRGNGNAAATSLRAHGLRMDAQHNLYCIDYIAHSVVKLSVR